MSSKPKTGRQTCRVASSTMDSDSMTRDTMNSRTLDIVTHHSMTNTSNMA